MSAIVAAGYSHRSRYLPILEEQAKARGFGLVSQMIQDFSWRNYVLWTLRVAKNLPNDLLFFVGAWDTACVGDLRELRDLNLESRITLTGDTNCWPHDWKKSEYEKKAPGISSPWRYVNTGPLVGLGSKIAEAIEWGWERFPVEDKALWGDDNDQRFWTDLFLQSPFDITIDYRCQIGQCIQNRPLASLWIEWERGKPNVRGRMRNDVMGTHPVFIHANGQNDLPYQLLEW